MKTKLTLAERFNALPKWLQETIVCIAVVLFALFMCAVPKESPEEERAALLSKQDAQRQAAIERQARDIAADMIAAKGINDGQ